MAGGTGRAGQTRGVPARRPEYRPVSISASHWRADGQPKTRYATQREAREAAEFRGAEAGVRLGTYRCDFCGGWHMGRRADPGEDERKAGADRPGQARRRGDRRR